MAYIGTKPIVGNFQICDAISVVNGQAAYTMQVGSVNVIPQSANHMIVSLNSCIQKPNSSFTVSGSTITFSSNLVTGDVIDFIQILGDVLDLGVPSDATVTTAKVVDGAITSAKLASGVGGVAGITSSADATAMTIDSTEHIGIGETTPFARVHIKDGDSGVSSTNIQGDELVLEDSSTTGMSILSGTSGVGNIFFGDSDDNDIGRIYYDHGANALVSVVNAAERMRIDNAGNLKYNSGFGSVSTAYGVRAWIIFDGTGTIGIDASGGVSSIADVSVGSYTVNLSPSMPDVNYAIAVNPANGLLSTGNQQFPVTVCDWVGSSSFTVNVRQCDNDANTFISADGDPISVIVSR